MSIATKVKDPEATKKYTVSWADYLTALGGLTIADSAWIVPSGITSVSESSTTTTATITLSGGTAGTDYELVNHVTLSDGQEDERAITLRVRAVESSVSTWSYDPTNLDVPLNKVRFLIGDTVVGDPLIEADAEIYFCLSEKGNNIYRAAAFACRRAAAKIVRELSLTGEIESLDRHKQYQAFIELSNSLEMEAASSASSAVFAGGISKSDMDQRKSDTDRPAPAFTVDLHSV